MPEEHNRRLTDCLSNLLFVSEPSGVENLRRECIDMSRVHLVGDIMLETLQMFLPGIEEKKLWETFGLEPGSCTHWSPYTGLPTSMTPTLLEK